jgi:hypothetical protein
MDIRTLVLGLGVFCARFLLGWWLNIGTMFYGSGASQPRPVAAAEPATTGQGKSQAQPAQRFVAHVPVPVSSGSQSQSVQPKAPPAAAKVPQVKYAQQPKAKASNSSSSNSSSKPAIRIRRR